MMLSSHLSLTLALAATTLAAPHHPRDTNSTISSIQWATCTDINGTLPLECASLAVPLDYTNATSNATLTLELTRTRATSNVSRGSLLLNFGGPGENSRTSLAVSALLLSYMTGGAWDLVTFNARGTGNTLPFSCYADAGTRLLYQLANPLEFSNSSDVAIGRLWGIAELLAESCSTTSGDIGGLVGTAFVARDMMEVVDALGEDGLLRYWGFSYGTALGATAAAMFPDRVERVVLDGVLNPTEYYHAYDNQMFTDTDATFSALFTGCVARPTNCTLALAYPNATAAELEASVYALLDSLKTNPIPVAGLLIDYTLVKSTIEQALYSPATWPSLAAGLAALLSGDPSAIAAYATAVGLTSYTSWKDLLAAESTPSVSEALVGIKCSDKSARTTDLATLRPVFDELAKTSRIMGDVLPAVDMGCARWKMDAKERYEGAFEGIATRKPVLLIGNTFDPFTPLVSARNVSAGLEGSVVLEQRGYGHSSLAQPSLCTAKTLQAFLEDGTLPEPGTVCPVDVELFDGRTWLDVFA